MSLPPSLLSPLARESLDALDVCESPDALGWETAALRSFPLASPPPPHPHPPPLPPPPPRLPLINFSPPPSPAELSLLDLQAPPRSASAFCCRPSRLLPHLSSSAACVSVSQVEVGATGRSSETLSAAVSSLPLTRGRTVNSCCAQNNFGAFSCQNGRHVNFD